VSTTENLSLHEGVAGGRRGRRWLPASGELRHEQETSRYGRPTPTTGSVVFRQLQTAPVFSGYALTPLAAFADAYAEGGPTAPTNRAETAAWLENKPLLAECFARILATSDRRVFNGRNRYGWIGTDTGQAQRHLGYYALWQAAEAERRGAILEAYQHLLVGWRLEQAFLPDIPGSVSATFGAVWRRLALTEPPPPSADAMRLMTALVELSQTTPPLESVFIREVWSRRDRIVSKSRYYSGGDRTAASQEVDATFTGAFAEVGNYLRHHARRAVGQDVGQDSPPSGLRRLDEGFWLTCDIVLVDLTRTNDLARMYDAYVTGVLSRLRAGQTNEALLWAEKFVSGRFERLWHRLVDRPLVWGVPLDAGSPRRCLERTCSRLLHLESSRLTLALSLYRHAHSQWPDRLEELAPEFIPAVPLDPFTGKPFGYRVASGDYLFASAGQDGRMLLSTNRLADRPTHSSKRVFGSAEPALAQAAWKHQQEDRRNMVDLRMLLRYGLLPKGTRIEGTNVFVPASTTNPARGPALDLGAMQRQGLLPKNLNIILEPESRKGTKAAGPTAGPKPSDQ